MNDELASVSAFMDWMRPHHKNQPEYLQAVQGVVEHVLEDARDDKALRQSRILQRLTEPDRTISFRVVWEDDEGRPQINRGYRVQHSNALGPYKGGLRFDPSVDISVLKFLAFEQLFKNSLTGLNLGAGKGGSDFDPKGRSDSEIMRFCHSFMTELHRHIGQQTDVPAGDIGVGAREIGYLFGQYKRLENQFTGTITGKSVGAGGSLLRTEATGYGAIYFLNAMLEQDDRTLSQQRIAISGAGNVSLHAAEKASAKGATVVTLSNRNGTLSKSDGLSDDDVAIIKRRYLAGDGLDEIAQSVSADWLQGEKPWNVDCDIAIPGATQNELDEDDARSLVDNGCRYLVEAANMPLTDAAARHLSKSDVTIAPGKAANAGGVAVSGFEMSQNKMGRSWPKDRLDQELCDTMMTIFARCRDFGQDNGRIDYRRGADRAGFDRVARAVAAAGIM